MERRRLLHLTKQSQILLSKPKFLSSLNRTTILRTGPCKRDMANRRFPSKPRIFPSVGWDGIGPSVPVEEESIPTNRAEKFYPVYIGELFNYRYQVVGKLGYGSSATIWLCRDLV